MSTAIKLLSTNCENFEAHRRIFTGYGAELRAARAHFSPNPGNQRIIYQVGCRPRNCEDRVTAQELRSATKLRPVVQNDDNPMTMRYSGAWWLSVAVSIMVVAPAHGFTRQSASIAIPTLRALRGGSAQLTAAQRAVLESKAYIHWFLSRPQIHTFQLPLHHAVVLSFVKVAALLCAD